MKALKNYNKDISNVDEKSICHKDMSKNNNNNAMKFELSWNTIRDSSNSDASSRYSNSEL